jgi:AraC-like DNA-binding protein
MPMTALHAEKLPAWAAALTDFAISPRIAGGEGEFRGCVNRFRSPRGISFSILESGPQRLSPMEGRAEDEIFWLSMVLDGQSALLRDDQAPAPLAPGDILYGKRGAAGSLDIRTPFRMAMANIPTALLAQASLVPLPTRIVHLRNRKGTSRVLGAMLGAIAESIDQLDDAGSFAIEGALVQLVVSTLFDDTGIVPLGGLASSRAATLRRIWQSIELRLQDGGLTLATIAGEHRLSTRYVQLLFEESGQTFRGHVRARRLEKCREALADPLNANVSITEICLHWGFGDSASFSRAFREAYDCTPSGYRRTAIGRRSIDGRLRGLTIANA